MNRLEAIEFLKLHFGTLFLTSYDLPTLEHVKTIIGSGLLKFTQYQPFVSIGCVMQNLIAKVISRSNELLYLSDNKFLNAFSDRLNLFGESIAPTNLKHSAQTFFQKFFDYDYCPVNDEEIEMIVEWSLFAIQFEEANKERVRKALDLLIEVQDHLYTAKFKAMFDTVEKQNKTCNVPKPIEKKETEVAQNTAIVKNEILWDSDTKSCDCYEYEISGDCYHVDGFDSVI